MSNYYRFATTEEQYTKYHPDLRREDVRNLLDWASKQPHLPTLTEMDAILFLHSCYYKSELAKKTLDTFFTIRTKTPEVFKDRNPRKIKQILSIVPIENLPNGGVAVLIKLKDLNLDNFNLAECVRLFEMVRSLHLAFTGPKEYTQFIMDLTGFAWGYILKMDIALVAKMMSYVQEGAPVRLTAVHVINGPSIVDKMIGFFKPFMKGEIFNMIKVYKSQEEFLKVFPQQALPAEYGGKIEASEEIDEKWRRILAEHEDYFRLDGEKTVDETKRVGKTAASQEIDAFGSEGTFKMLNID